MSNRIVVLLVILRILLGFGAARGEVDVDGPSVQVTANAYYAVIDIKRHCTARITYHIRKGSLDGEVVTKRSYWTDDKIKEFCPDPKKYGTREIPRGHLRALMLTPKKLERDVNYAANLIPLFERANLEMLKVDRRIRDLSKDQSLLVQIYMGWDESPRLLRGTSTDIPDTISYVIISPSSSKTLLKVTIQNKE